MLKRIFGLGKKQEEEVREAPEVTPEIESSDECEKYGGECGDDVSDTQTLPEDEEAEFEALKSEVPEIALNEYEDDDTQIPSDIDAENAYGESKEEQESKPPAKVSIFKRLKDGLSKTSKSITDKIDVLIHNYGEIDDDLFEELEEILITADIGMDTTLDIVEELKLELIERKIKDASYVKSVMRDVMVKFLDEAGDHSISMETPQIILVIGVNGAGKTTSIGKIAAGYKSKGKSVMLAAADTFRAAAVDQLKLWGERSKVPVIAHNEGADPAAVIYDAIHSAKSKKIDILICDTAGRLHNKKNLMSELGKIFKIIDREYREANLEVLLVLDATTGQNGIVQAKAFKEVANITGIVLTKLDGTAKGGVILSIGRELGIPVKLIGVGEGIDDLQNFDSKSFVEALLNLDD